ncbi:MAG: helix-turn-helix transcriptional regulator [Chloroflexota bacterium]|nr:helix-turn-helix transcriptional regulator [Chloroflexota bacterium]
MPRLSRAHEHAKRQINDLAAAGLPPKRLTIQIADTLEDAIGWDGYRMFGLDGQTLLINGLLGASENDAEARLEWLREVYLAMPTPYAELPELARSGLRGVAFQERQHECWGYAPDHLATVTPQDHYRHYHEGQSPVGGTILAIFRDRDRPVAAMQAYRRDPARQFRATDVAFVRQMSPIIGKALAIAAAREQALLAASVESSDASGILLVGEKGDVQFATPAGERWLDVIADAGDGLPMSMWATMAALRQADFARAATVTVPTAQGRVRVEASASGQPGVAAIVIAAEAPLPVPEVPASWGLTPQERAVVTHLATGKGNAGIAEAMFIGEHTVEWHLRSVYGKLGVRSRQEVISAMFRQVLLPGIEQNVLGQG